MSVRRNIKNVVYNYSEAARKAREATSNDPWGPSTSLMQELSDLTYNMAAYNDIMPIVWKRLNDHGKNWRHVYKSLVLFDYLVRYGSKRITQQCKENIFVIQTLKDFQYIEGNRDQGQNVREKAKQLVALLKDDERLKNERAKAEALRNRMLQDYQLTATGGANRPSRYGMYPRSSPMGYSTPGFHYQDRVRADAVFRSTVNPAVAKEYAAPKDAEEEAMQVQVALALSKEEADEAERQRKSDYIKMSLAVDESLKHDPQMQRSNLDSGKNASENDLLSILDGLSFDQSRTPRGDTVDDSHILVNRPVSANPWISQPNSGSRFSGDDIWGIPSTPWTPLRTTDSRYDADAAWNDAAESNTSKMQVDLSYPQGDDPQPRNRLGSYDLYNLIGVSPADTSTNKNLSFRTPPNISEPTSLADGSNAPNTSSNFISPNPDSFLGEHAPLVDLNNLTAPDYKFKSTRSGRMGGVESFPLSKSSPLSHQFTNPKSEYDIFAYSSASSPQQSATSTNINFSSSSNNPFVLSSMTSAKTSTNPFIESAAKPPTLNELSQQQMPLQSSPAFSLGFEGQPAAVGSSASLKTSSTASKLPPPLNPISSKPSSPFDASA